MRRHIPTMTYSHHGFFSPNMASNGVLHQRGLKMHHNGLKMDKKKNKKGLKRNNNTRTAIY